MVSHDLSTMSFILHLESFDEENIGICSRAGSDTQHLLTYDLGLLHSLKDEMRVLAWRSLQLEYLTTYVADGMKSLRRDWRTLETQSADLLNMFNQVAHEHGCTYSDQRCFENLCWGIASLIRRH